MSTEQETPTEVNPWGWSSITRTYLAAAGRRCGFYVPSPHAVPGYHETLVRDGAATWAEDDMLELTDAGWEAFYKVTGYRRESWNRMYQGGKRRADCALVVFSTGDGSAERPMLVEARGRDWEAACREDWALHPNGGWVFVRVEELGHPGRQR